MSEPEVTQPQSEPKERVAHSFRNLRELVDFVAGKSLPPLTPEEGRVTEQMPFPFLAIVGQQEMKLALLLGLINPNIGGILLVGPRGTAKTTAVRSLLDLLPQVERSTCPYGCLPEDIETGGISAVCPDCAKKYGEGQPLTAPDPVRLIELPLNARLEDVVGGIDEHAAAHERMRVRRGILAQADRNLLYIDEINLLGDDIVDSILDAAAQGSYTVRRGPIAATYRSRFVLIGSMNPEEGRLRPQIQDRFGLRVLVRGATDAAERLEIYHRVRDFQVNPYALAAAWAEETIIVAQEIAAARLRLGKVTIPSPLERLGLKWIRDLGIDSHRAEVTLFEAARARAAADEREEVTLEDLRAAASIALRQRRSQFIDEFFTRQREEDDEIAHTLRLPGRKRRSRSTRSRRK